MYQLLFVAILFTCAFLSYISPLSSAVGVGFGLVILVLMSVVMVIPWRSCCRTTLVTIKAVLVVLCLLVLFLSLVQLYC